MDVVVDGRCQKVVSRRNGVHVTGEMEVDVFHGQDLGITAAGSAAFDAKDRAERRFAQGDDGLMAHVIQGLCQADGR